MASVQDLRLQLCLDSKKIFDALPRILVKSDRDFLQRIHLTQSVPRGDVDKFSPSGNFETLKLCSTLAIDRPPIPCRLFGEVIH
jgi:hypothetical protein